MSGVDISRRTPAEVERHCAQLEVERGNLRIASTPRKVRKHQSAAHSPSHLRRLVERGNDAASLARLLSAGKSVAGEIIVGEEDLRLLLADPRECFAFMHIHSLAMGAAGAGVPARLGVGRLIHSIPTTNTGGEPVALRIFYPRLVREYIAEVARCSARAAVVAAEGSTKHAADGGAR